MNEAQKKTAFMDTNALLRMFMFWEACQMASTAMVDVEDWRKLQTALKEKDRPIMDQFNSGDFGPIQNGLQCFNALYKAQPSYNYFSCQISRAEMHRVLLSAHAHEEMNRHRIPLSLQQSRPLILHKKILNDSDYQNIEHQIKEFFETLRRDYKIDIKNVEDDRHGDSASTEDILLVAQEIWSRILTQTMDAYIYAAAIACEADYFLTSDQALRDTANKISSPDEEWKEVAEALQQTARATFRLSETSKFPVGCNLNIQLP